MSFGLGFWAAAGGVAAPTDYELIATAFGTGSSGVIGFNSIPSTYKHLQIRAVARSTQSATSTSVVMSFNVDGASNYSYHLLRGTGTGVISAAQAPATFMVIADISAANSTSNAHGSFVTDVLDPFSNSKNKTIKTFGGQMDNTYYTQIWSGSWRSTAIVDSIQITCNGGNFTSTSRFSLYGIKG
jgi:hypothetical protein